MFRRLKAALHSYIEVNKGNIEVEHPSDGYIEINGKRFLVLATAITGGATATTMPDGSFAVTTHATGLRKQFVSDGSVWQEFGAGGGGGSTILFAVLTAAFSRDNDTPTNVTDLTLNLEAGKTYRITGRGQATSDTVGFEWNLEGGTAVFAGGGGMSVVGKGIAVSIEADSFSAGPDSAIKFSFDATYEIQDAGTLVPQFYQSVTDVDPAVLSKYATIQAFDITPTP